MKRVADAANRAVFYGDGEKRARLHVVDEGEKRLGVGQGVRVRETIAEVTPDAPIVGV